MEKTREVISVQLSKEQKERAIQLAKENRMTLSQWARFCTLGIKPKPRKKRS